MNKIEVSIILILLPFLVKAQMSDNFSDGDFTANPEWIGDAPQFKVNSSLQLQLNSTGDNTSCLATACNPADSMEWSFWVKLAFSPSDNNFTRIYLMSDQQELKNNLNGYYVKLGESGANDAIELVKQSGNIMTTLCRGSAGLISGSFAIRIRVIRSPGGSWQVYCDPAGGTEYGLQGTANDKTFGTSSWFGFYCKYTSSNSSKFYFDEVYAGPVRIDNLAPELQSVSVFSSSSLKLQFTEAVDSVSASNPANYSADQGLGPAVLARRDPENHSVVLLTFPGEFIPDLGYLLSVINIRDLAGNLIQGTQMPFSRHIIRAFDVLINEIMADPDPPVGLPGFEYLELFNRCNSPVDLLGWSLTTGSSIKQLPSFVLPATGYVILANDAAGQALEAYGPVITFSSFSLLNTRTSLLLKNPEGQIIHSVSYSEDWYRSDYKKEGGWSLEQIDPLNPCGDAGNWMASNDPSGGSPGKVNSVNAPNPDHLIPSIARVGIPDNRHLLISFSESMDSSAIADPLSYSVDHGAGNPLAARAVSPAYKQAEITLADPVSEGIIYTLTLSGSMTDCAGNALPASSSARFAIPAVPKAGEIVLNEILFDPKAGCVDFVEIYNRSSAVMDLRDLTLATYDTLTAVLSSVSDISKESILLFPGDYYLLTSDTAAVKQCYYTTNPGGFIRMEHLPAMNNDAGSVALALKTGNLIDHFSYTASMQYPLLSSAEGVSLERINPDRPSEDISNWHSAAENVGFATPAYRNSQFGVPENSGNEISLSPDIFSPDNDGHNDNLDIAYSFSTVGYNITITVYDATGHLIRNLVSNELCGTSGSYSWDGITNRRLKAPIGRYIIYIEVFDLNGNVKRFKRTTVLGGKL